MHTYREGCARGARSSLAWGAALACAMLAVALPAAADARPPIETVLQDDAALLYRTDSQVQGSMRQLRELGVDRVRLTAGWSVIAPEPDSAKRPEFDATDPDAYPRANWRNLDRAVRLANDAGLEAMVDIAFWAPRWATSGDPGGGRARWNVNPGEYAKFATAVVRRYSGRFVPEPDDGSAPPPSQDRGFLETLLGGLGAGLMPSEPSGTPDGGPAGAPLPTVSWWTIWNEPNYHDFLQPQYVRDGAGRLIPNSPHLYRRLVQAAYPSIKRLQPHSTVLVGGTANSETAVGPPSSPTDAMAPLRFVRELACVDRRLRPLRAPRCRDYKRLQGDGFAHHPYSLLNRPDFGDRLHPDMLPIAGLDRLTRTLDRLARDGRIDRKLTNLYLTEFGYETNPPDPIKPFNPEQQARYINWAEFLASRNPRLRSWPQFLLRDMDRLPKGEVARGKREFADWQTGLLFTDGTPKPAATSFKLALFVGCKQRRARVRVAARRGRDRSRRAHRRLVIWGHVRPGRGIHRVRLEAKRRGAATWRPARTAARMRRGRVGALAARAFATASSGTFVRYAPYRRRIRYRLTYTGADGRQQSGLEVAPVGCGARRRELPGRRDGEY